MSSLPPTLPRLEPCCLWSLLARAAGTPARSLLQNAFDGILWPREVQYPCMVLALSQKLNYFQVVKVSQVSISSSPVQIWIHGDLGASFQETIRIMIILE
ncbi:hypothetical protein Csa_019178 [Cucumis sativus]|nr:hypothetical protein Csa_019178 [Cucumis sativus]